jgi:DNA-directed RNA polymerase subunit RPC12/RpoP
MDQHPAFPRTCPACGSSAYLFRGRKTVPPEPGQPDAQAVETKYRCKHCGHQWRVRAPRQA